MVKLYMLVEKDNFEDIFWTWDLLKEPGIYHVKQRGEKIAKGQLITFGLAGNQNCGKTTLFNQLTGANQHVGNFPGVTVDRKDGPIRGQENTMVVDLPGI